MEYLEYILVSCTLSVLIAWEEHGTEYVAFLVSILPADINECEEFGICPQSCRNSKGSYECFCVDGFKSMSTHYGERCAADGTKGPCLEQVTSGGHQY